MHDDAALDIYKISSLKKRADFLRLNKSKKWVSKHIVVQAAPSLTAEGSENRPEGTIQTGFTVTKKTYKSAVKRNRIKRRLRALADEVIAKRARPDFDYVLIGKQGALDAPYDQLKRDLKWCLKRLEVLR